MLNAFGVGGRNLMPLPGGQLQTWLAGDLVLKPTDADLRTLTWIEALTKSLDGRTDFRVAPPVRSGKDRLVVDGWTAWRYEPGDPASERYSQFQRTWDDVLAVGDLLNTALATEPQPALLKERSDRWAMADKVVWGSEPFGLVGKAIDYVRLASTLLKPIAEPFQLVHGDLTNNVMFADGLPPLLLDFSPYWRPPTYALAVVVVDVMAWHADGVALASRQKHRPGFGQYLLRAALFRLLSEEPAAVERPNPYVETMNTVCRLIETKAFDPSL